VDSDVTGVPVRVGAYLAGTLQHGLPGVVLAPNEPLTPFGQGGSGCVALVVIADAPRWCVVRCRGSRGQGGL